MRFLLIRTSAMGDVALTVPVIKSFILKYPEHEVILLTRSAFYPFFSTIEGLKLIDGDFKNEYKGVPGLFTLFKQIRKTGKIDYVFDLHNVLRSKIICFLFRLTGSRVFVINKGRGEKRNLIKGRKKGNLKHTVDRYKDALASGGFPIGDISDQRIIPDQSAGGRIRYLFEGKDGLRIGVAPYARHELKMWPEKNMITLLNLISQRNTCHFYLFGGGDRELAMLNDFTKKVTGSTIIAGRYSLEEELAIIGGLDIMICMDSSNMHMAAITGIKVISIWGGTHPAAGFGALNQPSDYSVQIPEEDLTCRPCTIYGTGTCRRGDLACMNWLTPEIVYEKLVKLGLVK